MSNIWNPITLFRRILRAHRSLPPDLRYVGDKYVVQEFRSHKSIKDQNHLGQFFKQWNAYLHQIEDQTKLSKIVSSPTSDRYRGYGKNLTSSIIDKLDDDKASQLIELREATCGKTKSK